MRVVAAKFSYRTHDKNGTSPVLTCSCGPEVVCWSKLEYIYIPDPCQDSDVQSSQRGGLSRDCCSQQSWGLEPFENLRCFPCPKSPKELDQVHRSWIKSTGAGSSPKELDQVHRSWIKSTGAGSSPQELDQVQRSWIKLLQDMTDQMGRETEERTKTEREGEREREREAVNC